MSQNENLTFEVLYLVDELIKKNKLKKVGNPSVSLRKVKITSESYSEIEEQNNTSSSEKNFLDKKYSEIMLDNLDIDLNLIPIMKSRLKEINICMQNKCYLHLYDPKSNSAGRAKNRLSLYNGFC